MSYVFVKTKKRNSQIQTLEFENGKSTDKGLSQTVSRDRAECPYSMTGKQIARTEIIFSKYINTFRQRLNFIPQTKSVIHSGLPAAISKIIQEIDNHAAINRSPAIKHHHRPGKFNCPMENLIASWKSVKDGMPRIV
ncbi:hypothetical protein ACS0Y7_22435 [Burkholderia gladioli]|uniref:hypothetical protein n=1 Tax=Burkholderia gladioli TaxID=28095 RepID=UPI003F7A2DC4